MQVARPCTCPVTRAPVERVASRVVYAGHPSQQLSASAVHSTCAACTQLYTAPGRRLSIRASASKQEPPAHGSLTPPQSVTNSRRNMQAATASEVATLTTAAGTATEGYAPPAGPSSRVTMDTRGDAAPKQPVFKRMMSWLRDMALESFSSYDEEDGEVLSPAETQARNFAARSVTTPTSALSAIASTTTVVEPPVTQVATPSKNASTLPRDDRVVAPFVGRKGKHDAAVQRYLEGLGLTGDSVTWARLNVPELFDMHVKKELIPAYRGLFDLPNPPASLIVQLKTIAALHYLQQLGMVSDGAAVNIQASSSGSATVNATVNPSVHACASIQVVINALPYYNLPWCGGSGDNGVVVQELAAAGRIDELYYDVESHIKPLVELLESATLEIQSVVKAFIGNSYIELCHSDPELLLPSVCEVWSEMPNFFTSSYLQSISDTMRFLKALGLETPIMAAFVASVNPTGPDLNLEAKLKLLLEEVGLTRPQVAQLFREFPGIMTLDVDTNMRPLISFLRNAPLQGNGGQQGVPQPEIMRLITSHPSTFSMPVSTTEEVVLYLHKQLQDVSSVVSAMIARKDAPLALNCSLAATAVKDVHESFVAEGFSQKDIQQLTRKFPGMWVCNLSGKRYGPKMQYWKEELGYSASQMLECPMFLSYNLAAHTGPRMAACRAAGMDISPKPLAKLLEMTDAQFADSVCGSTEEEWLAFKKSWQGSREGRRWHCSADDIPGRTSAAAQGMFGDASSTGAKSPILTRFNTFKLAAEDLPFAQQAGNQASGPLKGDGM